MHSSSCTTLNSGDSRSAVGWDLGSLCSSVCRLQLDSGDEPSAVHIPAPFLFPTAADKASAARSSQLASAILTIGDTTERAVMIRRLLLASGRRLLNQRDPRGRTPLMHAVAWGELDLVKLLVSCPKIEMTGKDRFGNTILMYASGHGFIHVLRALLQAFRKRTCDEHWPSDMLTFLYTENYDEQTAFTLALSAGHEDCIQVLSEYFKVSNGVNLRD